MCVVLDWDTSGLRNSEESRGFKDKWQIGLHVNPPPPLSLPKKKKGSAFISSNIYRQNIASFTAVAIYK